MHGWEHVTVWEWSKFHDIWVCDHDPTFLFYMWIIRKIKHLCFCFLLTILSFIHGYGCNLLVSKQSSFTQTPFHLLHCTTHWWSKERARVFNFGWGYDSHPFFPSQIVDISLRPSNQRWDVPFSHLVICF